MQKLVSLGQLAATYQKPCKERNMNTMMDAPWGNPPWATAADAIPGFVGPELQSPPPAPKPARRFTALEAARIGAENARLRREVAKRRCLEQDAAIGDTLARVALQTRFTKPTPARMK